MKIFMTGGTGFVGTTLVRELTRQGHQVSVLTRSPKGGPSMPPGTALVEGDPTRPGSWQEEVGKHGTVVNLAGSPIFKRWTKETKQRIRDSRVLTTQHLVEALGDRRGRETTLLSGSAIGYYGFHGDEPLDEESPPGDDFLASVARDWEAAALEAEQYGVNVCCCRFGIVMGREGGALAQMVPLFRKGLGSPLGSGDQWVSWIHEQDLARIFLFLMERAPVDRAVNCTTPQPVTNRELTHALGEVLEKPTFMPAVPGFMVRMSMGEFGSVLLKGQKVLPRKLQNGGFRFRFPDIRSALQDLLG